MANFHCVLCGFGGQAGFLGTEVGEEVHLERAGELRRRAEGEVDVLAEHLRDVRTGDTHALGEVGLGDAELLHAQEDLAQERRADVVDRGQSSRPMGYAVEYLNIASSAAYVLCRGMMLQTTCVV